VQALAGVSTARLLQEAMRVAELNHRVIANNIANVDTPNFNPTEVDFQATLRAALEGRGRIALRRTLPAHIEAGVVRPHFESLAFLSKNDYNKVDLDREIVKLSENTANYTVYSSLLAKQFRQVRNMLTNLR